MTLFTSYTRSSGFILCACTSRMFVYCLKFPISSYNSFLIEPKGGSENRVRERECEKWRLKERNQREKSIDEAISPPPPRVQCISFSPWNTITRREEWEEEEERKVREERCWRRKKKKWTQEKYILMRQCFNYLLQRKHCTNNSFKHFLVWTLSQPTFCEGESAYNSLTQQIQQCYRLLLREGDTGSKNTVWTVSFHLYLIVLLKNGTHAHNSVNVKQNKTKQKKVH